MKLDPPEDEVPHPPETDRDIAAPPYPALETGRLRLRPLALDDAPMGGHARGVG